ncbi:proteasome assembly chaperone family protein [Gulosibacter molinativorax]|uniref:PAC2 family protein n=1 Tax=Gulosibacter molinativorax TaxID=256821 RepID=A0ABT7C4M8_9MICO|nr:PAC2 family protein [Gulosibacter molinativorax]MDJ1370162.1 PAC2 family protein [Gulosibacter molinativorax]QUY61573.1 PAC2 family protein [Gulosibacter molinativorax]
MGGQGALFRPGDAWGDVPTGLPLVVLLTGYRDSGATVRQTMETMIEHGGGEIVAQFSPDALLDYRARRPIVTIDGSEVREYRIPRLDLRLLKDSIGQQYLLLSGYEPDFRWEEFTRIVVSLVHHFRVGTTTWAHAIPMPVPHTRPLRLTATGNRSDIVDQLSVWKAKVEAPAHALHLLEHELMVEDEPVASLVVLVPHYLAEGVVPAGPLKLLEALGTTTGLLIPTEDLREKDRAFRAEVDEQIASNEEVQRLIAVLENQHDGFLKGTPQENPFADADGEMPTADEIAAELERYLSARRDRDHDE